MTASCVEVARARRPISFDMFAALLPDAQVIGIERPTAERPTLAITFDRDLTSEEWSAVEARLLSTDDADMASRAALAELAAQVEAMDPTPVRLLLLRLAARALDA